MRPSLFMFLLPALACGGATVTPPQGSPEPERAASAYRVQAPGGAESTLVGTLHLGVVSEDILPLGREALLDDARVLLLEIDETQAQSELDPTRLLLPAGSSLRDTLGADTFLRLRSELPDMPGAGLNRLEPAGAFFLYFVQRIQRSYAELNAGGGDAPAMPQMDADLAAEARSQGVPTAGLETLDEQLDALFAVGDEVWVEALASAFEAQPELDGEQICALADEIDAGGAYTMGMGEAFDRILLDERNARWMPRLERELSEGKAVVAVGMAHLYGEGGLVQRLRRAGFEVQPLAEPPCDPDEAEALFAVFTGGREPDAVACIDGDEAAACLRLAERMTAIRGPAGPDGAAPRPSDPEALALCRRAVALGAETSCAPFESSAAAVTSPAVSGG